MKLEVGNKIVSFFGEEAKVVDVFFDKTVRDEKCYVLDKTIKVKNSKEPYGNKNREQYIYRNDNIIETSDIKTTVKDLIKESEDK